MEDGASIGTGAVIMGGVTIGKNAMIGAGAVAPRTYRPEAQWRECPPASFVLPQTLTGLGILWVVATLAAYAFQTVELKNAVAWTSLTYIPVVIMSRIILREK